MNCVRKLFSAAGLLKAAKEVNFYGGISLWASALGCVICIDLKLGTLLIRIWFLASRGRKRMWHQGSCSARGSGGPFQRGQLPLASLLPGLPDLAHLLQFCCLLSLTDVLWKPRFIWIHTIIWHPPALVKYSYLEVEFWPRESHLALPFAF